MLPEGIGIGISHKGRNAKVPRKFESTDWKAQFIYSTWPVIQGFCTCATLNHPFTVYPLFLKISFFIQIAVKFTRPFLKGFIF
jgi:hypothetical protein